MAAYGNYLRALLAPLGVYDLSTESLSGSELDAMGAGLDDVSDQLAWTERESILSTAEDEGLTLREDLFARRPANYGTALRRAAIAALLRISGDSFTLQDINSAISGCGIKAEALEMGEGHIRVIFPDVAGVPEGFDQIEGIILDIIPCHLATEFYFRYLTWAECEAAGYTWAMIHAAEYTWHEFELAV